MEHRTPESWTVYCDDCGHEKMAEIRGGKLVIMDRRHGKRHIAIVPIEDMGRWRAATDTPKTGRS